MRTLSQIKSLSGQQSWVVLLSVLSPTRKKLFMLLTKELLRFTRKQFFHFNSAHTRTIKRFGFIKPPRMVTQMEGKSLYYGKHFASFNAFPLLSFHTWQMWVRMAKPLFTMSSRFLSLPRCDAIFNSDVKVLSSVENGFRWFQFLTRMRGVIWGRHHVLTRHLNVKSSGKYPFRSDSIDGRCFYL